MKTALIDGDQLVYEIGFGTQYKDEVTGELIIRPWEAAEELLTGRINVIKEETESDDVLLFITGSEWVNRKLNKTRAKEDKAPVPFVPNFRHEIAVSKGYKANRVADKPFHYRNILAHILDNYPCHVSETGLEADDDMAIYQVKANKEEGVGRTISCSRDKDQRMIEGDYYAWEIGKQASIGPITITQPGYLIMKDKKKLFGVGNMFFYSQLITGDRTDNIEGLPGKGDVFAYNLLHDVKTEREMYELVAECYVKHYGDEWETRFIENSNLLWIVRELNEDGSPVLWKAPPMAEPLVVEATEMDIMNRFKS